ncbi:MAG: HD domain-containing protein [Ruminococcus sp.]|nr:HD domain-containing protein [Ruminococcus sp.]
MTDKLKNQLAFLYEADKMKNIFRQTLVGDGTRQENDAEHSWHMALTAMTLFDYAEPGVDLFRVLKMCLVHDLVEVYAGDTPAIDNEAAKSKEMREKAAADKMFAMLPPEQGAEYRSLWEEFDAEETKDAGFAAACDRFQSAMLIYKSDGYTWRKGNWTTAEVIKRQYPVKTAMPEVWEFIENALDDLVKRGILEEGRI